MTLKCAIIDDEPLARECISNYIREVDFLEVVGEGNNPLKLIEIQKEQHLDLIFLDIQMPIMNGMEYLKLSDNRPSVILTTAYPNYALEGFDLDVLDYLLKPITFNRFYKAAKKAWEYHQITSKNQDTEPVSEPSDYFFVKNDKAYDKIYAKDILFIEGMQNYVAFHTTNGKKHLALLPLKKVEENLKSNHFFRVHKSFIVSIEKIESVLDNRIHIKNFKIPIGRNYKNQVMKIIQNKRW